MAHNDCFDEARGKIRNEKSNDTGRREEHGQKRNPLKAVRQRAANGIAQRERYENHADLAYPDIKRTAEIFGEVARADNLQDHNREAAEENQDGGGGVTHRTIEIENGKMKIEN